METFFYIFLEYSLFSAMSPLSLFYQELVACQLENACIWRVCLADCGPCAPWPGAWCLSGELGWGTARVAISLGHTHAGPSPGDRGDMAQQKANYIFILNDVWVILARGMGAGDHRHAGHGNAIARPHTRLPHQPPSLLEILIYL